MLTTMQAWIEKLRKRKMLAAGMSFLILASIFLKRTLVPPQGQVLGGHDLRGYYHPFLNAVRDGLRNGELPFWTPYLFNGLPLLSDPQIGAFYPPAWLALVLPANIGLSWYMLFHIWLAGLGMFLFVRIMGGDWLPALLSGIVFAFSGLLAGRLWAGHTIVYAMVAWIPWLLLALIWSVRKGKWWHGVLAGVPLGLAILSGHIPSFLYAGLILAAYCLYLFITERERRWLVLRQGMLMVLAGLASFLDVHASTLLDCLHDLLRMLCHACFTHELADVLNGSCHLVQDTLESGSPTKLHCFAA